jgi:hypothetical protein
LAKNTGFHGKNRFSPAEKRIGAQAGIVAHIHIIEVQVANVVIFADKKDAARKLRF